MPRKNRKLVGVWLDHSDAWVVRYDRSGEMIIRLHSQLVPASQEPAISPGRREVCRMFYREIQEKVWDADELLLMGPDSAKTELKRVLERGGALDGKIRGTIPMDQLSEREIAALVRNYFHLDDDQIALAV